MKKYGMRKYSGWVIFGTLIFYLLSLLIPLNPNHSQLGFLFLTSWAVSTGSSPLSGVGLALVSRYQASPRSIIQNNYHYAIVMWAIACGMSVLFFAR